MAVFACSTIPAQAYVSPVIKVSKERIRGNDGKVYYCHIVKEKETLFAISKAYNVTVEDIYKINPGLKEEGLKKGSTILVPIVELKQEEKQGREQDKQTEPREKQDIKQETGNISDENFILHKVRWYESLEDIAAKYNISEESIIIFNNLKNEKINSSMTLKIPQKEVTGRNVPTEKQNIFFGTHKHDFRIGMYIPFDTKEKTAIDNMDFYCGFVLGLKSAKKHNINVNLIVEDSKYSMPEKVKNCDLIIGPISAENMSKELDGSGYPMFVSPLDQKAASLAYRYENFIQIPPVHDSQYEDIINWIKEERSYEDNVMTVFETSDKSEKTSFFNKMIQNSSLRSAFFSYNILDGRAVTEKLESLAYPDRLNRVIINSENEAFVADVIRNLSILSNKNNKIVIYCLSKIKSFNTIDIKSLHMLRTHVSVPYHIDYENDDVQDFVLKFRSLFNCEPTQFAFRGYDIAEYFCELFALHGEHWKDYLTREDRTMLQSNIFLRRAGAGFVNVGTRKIIYDKDYSIKIYSNR